MWNSRLASSLAIIAIFIANCVWAQPSSNSPVCEGLTINLNAGINGDSYLWTGPNGFTSTQQNPSLPATLAASGSYRLEITVGANKQSFNTNVLVNAAPELPVVDNISGCAGELLQVNPNNIDNNLTYTWKLPDNTTRTGLPLNINTAGGNGTGNYTVTASNANCSSQVESFSIAVFNKPGLATVNGELNVCRGQDLNLSAINTQGNSVRWTTSEGNTVENPNLFIGAVGDNQAGTYTVNLYNPGCEGDPRNFNVKILTAPTGFTVSGKEEYCVGDNIVLNPSYNGSLARATYEWSGPNGYFSTQAAVSRVADESMSGDYFLRVTVNPNANTGDKCPSEPILKTVSVYSYPTNPTIGTNKAVVKDTLLACESDSVAIWASNIQAGWSTEFLFKGNKISEDTIVYPEISLNDTGAYRVNFINGICKGPNVNFNVALTEFPKILGFERPKVICEYDSVSIIPIVDGTYQFEWILNGQSFSNNDTLTILNIDRIKHSGELVLKSSYFGCEAPADTQLLSILSLIDNIRIFYDEPFTCEDEDLFLYSDGADSATYIWQGPNNFFRSEYNGQGYTQFFKNVTEAQHEGMYSVIITNACGSDTAYKYIDITKNPEFNLLGDTGICDYEETELYIDLVNPEDYKILWSSEDTLTFATFDQLGHHSIRVQDAIGCETLREFEIIPECDPTVFIPNAFTPNGDGINDELKLESHNVSRLEFKIFTRMGEEIFSTRNPDATWSGDGHPQGLYYYRLTYSGDRDRSIFNREHNGTFYIIK